MENEKRKAGRPITLTPEQIVAKRKARNAAYYAKNKKRLIKEQYEKRQIARKKTKVNEQTGK